MVAYVGQLVSSLADADEPEETPDGSIARSTQPKRSRKQDSDCGASADQNRSTLLPRHPGRPLVSLADAVPEADDAPRGMDGKPTRNQSKD